MAFYLKQLHRRGLNTTSPPTATCEAELNNMIEEWLIRAMEEAYADDITYTMATGYPSRSGPTNKI